MHFGKKSCLNSLFGTYILVQVFFFCFKVATATVILQGLVFFKPLCQKFMQEPFL